MHPYYKPSPFNSNTNKCIRIINHLLLIVTQIIASVLYTILLNTPFNSNTNNLFEENKLLKFDDIIKLEQLKLVFLFKNGDLPNELNNLFKLNVSSYNTRNASRGGLSIPKINATSFGSRSLRYSASVTWKDIKSMKRF